MRVLLSTIGSRGDVEPLTALALQLRELGQEVRICAPPDFREWIGTLGIPFVPVGPEVRQTAGDLVDSLGFDEWEQIEEGIDQGFKAARNPVELSCPVPEAMIDAGRVATGGM